MLASNILVMMGKRNMTQVELARKADLSPCHVNSTIRAKHGITVYTLRKIRDALECTWEELLD